MAEKHKYLLKKSFYIYSLNYLNFIKHQNNNEKKIE